MDNPVRLAGQNGTSPTIEATADIAGAVTMADRSQGYDAFINRVKIMLETTSKFDFFILTKRQRAGWTFSGNENCILVSKGQVTI